MTLLVGIRCTDGAVIAADSAVSLGVAAVSDRQRKISIIDDTLIVAGSGQVGLGQRFEAVVEDHWHSSKSSNAQASAIHMATAITAEAISNFQRTSAPEGQYGALVAFPAAHEIHICSFVEADFQPQLLTERMWYASMGWGQQLGNPYLRYMRHVFWQDGPPSLQGGRFAAMWVLAHAIEAAGGGDIARPIDMAVLQMTDEGPVARMLSQDELDEHDEAVRASTEHFREFERLTSGSPSVKPREIPKT